jgi:hypothetical protein
MAKVCYNKMSMIVNDVNVYILLSQSREKN